MIVFSFISETEVIILKSIQNSWKSSWCKSLHKSVVCIYVIIKESQHFVCVRCHFPIPIADRSLSGSLIGGEVAVIKIHILHPPSHLHSHRTGLQLSVCLGPGWWCVYFMKGGMCEHYSHIGVCLNTRKHICICTTTNNTHSHPVPPTSLLFQLSKTRPASFHLRVPARVRGHV